MTENTVFLILCVFFGALIGLGLSGFPYTYGIPFFGKKRGKENLPSQEKENPTDFETPMRKLLLESLERVNVRRIDLRYCPFNWSERLKEMLSFSIKMGFFSEMEVREFLDRKLKKEGRACFEQHLKRGTYPDHTFWPEALAYALRENEFSPGEMKTIRFDHGDTVGTFIQGYGKSDLLDVAFSALLPD